ncbi:uncharacterized protein LOC133546043 [Nerophis ophidion]|uniref:uncharacterized protein LOC133546043 n=1 Tax=Nerophis ophidion TaxID=159077 RepID=UPI002AE09C2F|nr:uncharacterized protein LOC133546043 [Nerophis ophidion]
MLQQTVQEHSGNSSINDSPMPKTLTSLKAKPAKYTTPEKVVKLSFPEYVLHTDTELEQVRKQYFELSKTGLESTCHMSKELRCRLIRNTMTSMMAILRARGDEGSDRYPSKPEITAMAKRIVQYYPMLQDKGLKNTWVTVFTQLYKRLQNVRSPQKRKKDGSHSKSSTKRRHLEHPDDTDEIDSNDSTVILDLSTEGSSSSDPSNKERGEKNPQLLLEEVTRLPSSPESNKPADSASPDAASQATLAKHYKALQALFKRKNPNYQDVSHLLDLEFAARRLFIDSDTIREEDRPEKILEAYPCFKDIGHVMDELRRILDMRNCNFISELKERWHDFCQKVLFFGVSKNMLKPPMGIDKVQQPVEILRVLPSLFPSMSGLPKKVRDLSQALVHVLEEKEDPNSYLRKRPLTCPVLIVSSSNCLLAVGNVPITTFPKDKVTEGAVYLMAYYYTLHLTYPKCVATLMSLIQTEVLLDNIHESDLTSSYKKSMAEWKAFIGQ